MASVAATVDTGDFHQPILVPGAAQVSATPLPASTDAYLNQLMRAVVTYPDGTARGVGFGTGVYAKTGTADVGGTQAQPNSWMIAFDPAKDIAVAALVQNAGYGASYAGPDRNPLAARRPVAPAPRTGRAEPARPPPTRVRGPYGQAVVKR